MSNKYIETRYHKNCKMCKKDYIAFAKTGQYCETCRPERAKVAQAAKMKEYMEIGKCRECGSPKKYDRKARCADCRLKMKLLRDSRISNGLCGSCERPHLQFGKNASKQCEVCILKATAHRHLGTAVKWPDLKALFIQQKGLCPYILKPIYFGSTASLDHKISRANGGGNNIENIEWIHVNINRMKGDMNKDEFIAWIKSNPIVGF